MNGLDRIMAALSRLHQEAETCRNHHQRRRLQGIERAIRKAITGDGADDGEGDEA